MNLNNAEIAHRVAALYGYADKWVCPYCWRKLGEEAARSRGCCGESSAHMMEPGSDEWINFVLEEE